MYLLGYQQIKHGPYHHIFTRVSKKCETCEATSKMDVNIFWPPRRRILKAKVTCNKKKLLYNADFKINYYIFYGFNAPVMG